MQLNKGIVDIVKEEVNMTTPNSVVELIALQLQRVDEACGRIRDEGLVVRDARGSVIPHPAIEIEKAATKIVCDLLKKFSKFKVTT